MRNKITAIIDVNVILTVELLIVRYSGEFLYSFFLMHKSVERFSYQKL